MSREELDAFFAKADDVLADWRGSDDAVRWRAPELNFDCPPLPRADLVAKVAATHGIDGEAAVALIGLHSRDVWKRIGPAFTEFIAVFRAQVIAVTEAMKPMADALARIVDTQDGIDT